jgi:hypothetical protein
LGRFPREPEPSAVGIWLWQRSGRFLPRNCRNKSECGGKAKLGKALEQTFCLLLLRTAVEVIWAKVLVLIATLNV